MRLKVEESTRSESFGDRNTWDTVTLVVKQILVTKCNVFGYII